MKHNRSLLALFALALTISVAFAAPASGKGPKAGKGERGCKPNVAFILKGTLLSTDTAASSLSMSVAKANKHGRSFVGSAVVVQVREATKIRREGRARLADLVEGDLVKVQVRECKNAEVPALVAKRVVARPAAAPSDGSEGTDPGPAGSGEGDTDASDPVEETPVS